MGILPVRIVWLFFFWGLFCDLNKNFMHFKNTFFAMKPGLKAYILSFETGLQIWFHNPRFSSTSWFRIFGPNMGPTSKSWKEFTDLKSMNTIEKNRRIHCNTLAFFLRICWPLSQCPPHLLCHFPTNSWISTHQDPVGTAGEKKPVAAAFDFQNPSNRS